MAEILDLPASYLAHRESMKSGDLIEWRSNTALGWLIRLFSRQEVNHTSLLIRPSELAGYHDRRFMLEALAHGVTPTLLSDRLANFSGQAFWIPLKPEFDSIRQELAEFAIEKMCKDNSDGKNAYDYPSVVRQIGSRVSVDAQRYFCSEWAQIVWTAKGILKPLEYALRPGEFSDHGVTLPTIQIWDGRKDGRKP